MTAIPNSGDLFGEFDGKVKYLRYRRKGETVEEAGYEVAGVAQSVDAALTTLSDRPVHAALLDVNLRGELVFAVADALAERGVPFVFVTGQPASSIPETHRHRPLVPKPYYDAALCAALCAVIATSALRHAFCL